MNTKKLIKVGTLLLMLTMITTLVAFSTTIYVNNNGGVDSRTGQNNNVGDNINGPVATFTRAVELAVAGDTLSVAFTGVPYAEPGAPAGTALLNKAVIIVATGGAPEISAVVDVVPGSGKTVKFGSAFTMSGTLTLESGSLTGGVNVTMASGATIRRIAATMDAAPTFTTTVNLIYSPGAAMTIGVEFPTDATILKNLTLTTGQTLTVNRAVQMKGVLDLDMGTLALGANTLTITSTATTTHTLDGSVTSSVAGAIVFSVGGTAATTITVDRAGAGALNLPSITVTAARTDGAFLLGSVNANAINLGSTTNAASLTNSGIGNVTVLGVPVDIKGNVVNSSSGNIAFGDADAAIGGNVTNSGSYTVSAAGSARAKITFGNTTGGNDVAIKGTVTNSATVSASAGSTTTITDMGNMIFSGGVSVDGSVVNSAVVTPVTSSASGNVNTMGNISFPDLALTVKGAVRNQSSQTGGSKTTSSTIDNLCNILFAHTGTNVAINGGLFNSSSGFTSSQTLSGRIFFSARAAGTVTVGLTAAKANVQNSSSNTGVSNGNIDFTAGATGAMTVNGTVIMDGSAGEGDILFGAGNLTTDGVTITRSVSTATVTFPANSATLSLGAVSITGGSNSVLTAGASTGAISVSSLTISAGKFEPGTGASTAAITFTGNITATGGTINFGTGIRTVNIQGQSTNINGVSFSNSLSTTLVFNRTSSPQSLVAGANTVFPGYLEIANAYVLAPTFSFPSGNFTVAAAKFTDNGITTNGVDLGTARLIISGNSGTFGGGDFRNDEGFTATTGVVTMQGSAAQVVAGTGEYYSVEINNAAGVTFGTSAAETHTITGTFYLTNGTASTGAGDAIEFDNATTLPTIVRRAGSFAGTPTFTTAVNVVYTGTAGITTSLELPTTATELNNLSVLTAGGNQTVTVDVAVNPTVNGTLTVNTGQTLALVDNLLTMKGASIVNNGKITNTNVVPGYILLDADNGTTVTGAGLLPPIVVGNSSAGNVISGSTGIGDNGGAAGTGWLQVNSGGTAGTITLSFSGSGPHILWLYTSDATNVVTLGANLVIGDYLDHEGGSIDLSTFNLTAGSAVVAAWHYVDVDATFASTGGSLIFKNSGAGNPKLEAAWGAATIDVPVVVNLSASTDALQITTNDFTFANAVTLTKGQLDLNALNVNLTGNALNLTADGSVVNTGLGGLLIFNPAAGDYVVTLAGATSLPDVQVSGNTTLAGDAGDLTMATLLHDGGVLNFADRDIIVTGPFSRTSSTATYQATSGALVLQGAFAQGTGFSIPNLTLNNLTAVTTVADAQDFTVTGIFRLEMLGGAGFETFTHEVTSARLHIAAGGTVEYVAGLLDVAPVYAGSITLVAANGVSGPIPATVWPSAPTTLVGTLRINAAAAGTRVELPGNRSVNTTLDLRTGILDLSTNNTAARTLTMVGTDVRRRQSGSVTLDFAASGTNAGTLTFSSTPAVTYEPSKNTADGGDMTVGKELPSTVTALTFTRSANVSNAVVTVNKAVTVTGNLNIYNNVTITSAGSVSVSGNVTIARENATWSNAGTPVTVFTGSMSFVGSADQTITVPSAGATISALTVNTTGGAKVTLVGGNLTIGTLITFTNGLFYTGTSELIFGGNAAGNVNNGYVRNVTGSNKSHVVGNVTVPLKSGQLIAFGRNDFPIGDATYFRPAAITIVNPAAASQMIGISATIKYDNTRPTGIVGLPIANGVSQGTDIARYPDFSWFIKTTGSLGQTQFNLELTAEGYADFDDIANVRMIRRSGTLTDVGNTWSLQGAQYDNFVIAGVPSVVNVNSTGGLIPGGAVYTYGLKSTMVLANPIADIKLTDAAKTFTRNLVNPALFTGAKGTISYSVTIDNPAVATAVIASNVLTVTLKVSGTSFVTVTGTDAFDGSRISHKVNVSCVSAVEVVGDIIPTDFSLAQNYPNPFNPSTTIRFGLAKEAPVTLEIYNLLGMKVRTLISGDRMSAAFYNIRWDGRDDAGVSSPSGIYIYRIVADKFVTSKKMTLIK